MYKDFINAILKMETIFINTVKIKIVRQMNLINLD